MKRERERERDNDDRAHAEDVCGLNVGAWRSTFANRYRGNGHATQAKSNLAKFSPSAGHEDMQRKILHFQPTIPSVGVNEFSLSHFEDMKTELPLMATKDLQL